MHEVYGIGRPADRNTFARRLYRVSEEGEFYIPDFTSENPYRSRPKAYTAANDHAQELRQAEQHLDDALNLARVLRASVQSEGDSRAMQADTVLRIIEERLHQGHACIDRHDARHLNLFLAYFDLKDRAPDTAEE